MCSTELKSFSDGSLTGGIPRNDILNAVKFGRDRHMFPQTVESIVQREMLFCVHCKWVYWRIWLLYMFDLTTSQMYIAYTWCLERQFCPTLLLSVILAYCHGFTNHVFADCFWETTVCIVTERMQHKFITHATIYAYFPSAWLKCNKTVQHFCCHSIYDFVSNLNSQKKNPKKPLNCCTSEMVLMSLDNSTNDLNIPTTVSAIIIEYYSVKHTMEPNGSIYSKHVSFIVQKVEFTFVMTFVE